MKTVQDICTLLESVAPLAYQESYDNAGLIVGNGYTVVTGVMICLDVSEPVIDEAIRNGCNLIISHHPLIFKGLKNITGNGRVVACLVKAIKHDLAIYASHTNLDSVLNGVNGMIARKIGLKDAEVLVPNQPFNASEPYGLGVVGNLETAVDEDEFLHLVKQTFKCQCLRYSVLTGKKVQRVAVCGGSGSEFLNQAKLAGATVFLTGEAHYHEFFTEGQDILLIDAGHFETEQFTKELFFEIISKKSPTFAIHISAAEKNPVNYL